MAVLSTVPSIIVTVAIFSSVVSANVAVVTDSTWSFATTSYVFLPVEVSIVGFTVIFLPALTSVKPVIIDLPASVILDKPVLANPVAPMVTLPFASFEMLILSPFFRFTLLFLGVTSSPLTDKFQRSDFFATPLIVAVVLGTTLPLPSEYVNVTSPSSLGVYSIGVICNSLFFKSDTALCKSFTFTAAFGLFVAATFKRSVKVGAEISGPTPWFSITDFTLFNTVGAVVLLPFALTKRDCTLAAGIFFSPATGSFVL